MKRNKQPKYQATAFFGADPASCRIDTIRTNSLADAKAHAHCGLYGVVSTEDDGTIYRTDKAA